MSYRFKEARLQAGITITELARRMGVSQTAASNWDLGKKVPATETLCKLADFYNVSIDYLLGRSDSSTSLSSESILIHSTALPSFHGNPVWDKAKGWGIVNAAQGFIIFMDGTTISIDEAADLRTLPPAFSIGYQATGKPISHTDLQNHTKLWIEPISSDPIIKSELKGWYSVKSFYVENEYGNRFFMDTYGSKWLAFAQQSI